MTLHGFQKRLQNFEIRDEVKAVLKETAPDIEELNRGQLYLGHSAVDDKPLENLKRRSTQYSLMWGEHREKVGLQTEHFDIRYSGAFWNSIKVTRITVQTFSMVSRDPDMEKRTNLSMLFGDQLLGLSPESRRKEYVPLYFYPALRQRIKSKLGV